MTTQTIKGENLTLTLDTYRDGEGTDGTKNTSDSVTITTQFGVILVTVSSEGHLVFVDGEIAYEA